MDLRELGKAARVAERAARRGGALADVAWNDLSRVRVGLGDARGCDYSQALAKTPPEPPTCDRMGGDPDHPVDLGLHLVPPPPGATLPPGVEPFARRPMPFDDL